MLRHPCDGLQLARCDLMAMTPGIINIAYLCVFCDQVGVHNTQYQVDDSGSASDDNRNSNRSSGNMFTQPLKERSSYTLPPSRFPVIFLKIFFVNEVRYHVSLLSCFCRLVELLVPERIILELLIFCRNGILTSRCAEGFEHP